MKVTPTQQAILNDFTRRYVDTSKLPGRRVVWNHKSYEGKNGVMHDDAVGRVCKSLACRGVPFATEVPLKCGNYLDVCAPTHVLRIIEVMHTETPEYMTKKILRLPKDLRDDVMIVHADKVMALTEEEVKDGAFVS